MSCRLFLFVALAVLGLSAASCSRGGRSPNWNQQTTIRQEPDPGSGQTGPGMTKGYNQVNGPNDSTRNY